MALHFSVLQAEAILGMTMPENQDGRKHALNRPNTDYTHNTGKSAEDTSDSGSHGGSKKLFANANLSWLSCCLNASFVGQEPPRLCSKAASTSSSISFAALRLLSNSSLQILEMPRRWNFKRVKNSYVISMKL